MSKRSIILIVLLLLSSAGIAALFVFQSQWEAFLFEKLCAFPEKKVYCYVKSDLGVYYLEQEKNQVVEVGTDAGKYNVPIQEQTALVTMKAENKSIIYPTKYDSSSQTFTLCQKKIWESAEQGEVLLTGISDYVLFDDGKLIYEKSGELHEIDGENERKLATSVEDWYYTQSGQDILYLKEDGSVYFISQGGSKANCIASNTENLHIYPMEDHFYLYYTKQEKVTKNVLDFVTDVRKREDEQRKQPNINDYSYSESYTDYFGQRKVTTHEDTTGYNLAMDEYQKKVARDEIRNKLNHDIELEQCTLYGYDTSKQEKEIYSGCISSMVFSNSNQPCVRISEVVEDDSKPDIETIAENQSQYQNLIDNGGFVNNNYFVTEDQIRQCGEDEKMISQAFLNSNNNAEDEQSNQVVLDADGKMYYFQTNGDSSSLWCDTECVMNQVYSGYLNEIAGGVVYFQEYDTKAEKGTLCLFKDQKSYSIAQNVSMSTVIVEDDIILYCTDYQSGKGGKLFAYYDESSYPIDTQVLSYIGCKELK